MPVIHRAPCLYCWARGGKRHSDYRALQPFGQVLMLAEDDLVLFESGTIVLYVGDRSDAPLKNPRDAA